MTQKTMTQDEFCKPAVSRAEDIRALTALSRAAQWRESLHQLNGRMGLRDDMTDAEVTRLARQNFENQALPPGVSCAEHTALMLDAARFLRFRARDAREQ